jgi:hypothetical protein
VRRSTTSATLPPAPGPFGRPPVASAPTTPADRVAGSVRLRLPEGWSAEPAERPFDLAARGEEAELSFTVRPPAAPGVGLLGAEARIGADGLHPTVVDRTVVRVEHPHVTLRTLFPPAEARLVRADVAVSGKRIGYLAGSGDEVGGLLGQTGLQVEPLGEEEARAGDLSRFDAIVAGVRAFNTRPWLRDAAARLAEYVEHGGTLVVQYATTADLVTDRLGPRPFHLSRDRVTVEQAPVRFLLPEHPLLLQPNRIGAADFDGWVQERGLYFADSWDGAYEAPLGMADPGEKELRGSLLFLRHGKGVFVYTGLAFFRQLPAGVPGAWRLFANLVSARAPGG